MINYQVVHRYPWSKVIKLICSDGVYYLKILPFFNVTEPKIIQGLYNQHPHCIPEVIAVDVPQGLFITKAYSHHRNLSKRRVNKIREELLELYLDIQLKSSEDKKLVGRLPKVPDINSLIGQLERFLIGNKYHSEDRKKLYLASYWIGKKKSRDCLKKIEKHRGMLEDLGQMMVHFPYVLCHGDLHIGNTGMSAQGGLIIGDWSDAIYANFGFSLSNLVGGCRNIDLITKKQLGDETSTQLIERYCNRITEFLRIPIGDVYSMVSMASFMGSVWGVIFFSKYGTRNSKLFESISEQITCGLDDIISYLEGA